MAATFLDAFPSTTLFTGPDPRSEALTECLWGDFARELGPVQADGWVQVRVRGKTGWVRDARAVPRQLLEVDFVDIGQGDGALVILPDDRKVFIDAGEGTNMRRYLDWRFNLKKEHVQKVRFDAVVLTHSDEDHYGGFLELVDHPKLEFGTVFHNGIFERTGSDLFGRSEKQGGRRYLVDLVRDRAQAQALLADAAARGKKKHPKLMWSFLQRGADMQMLSARPGQGPTHVPGFGPGPGQASFEVLGPVPEALPGGPALRWFGSATGVMKNGHSVVLRLDHGAVRIFLGGDLNEPAQDWLLEAWQGQPGVFRSDVAKACHHGSADLHTGFLDAISPLATVVSSGDDEPHCHPRPEALGVFGKHGRGQRPLLFSTELARSAPEAIIRPFELRTRILDQADRMVQAARSADPAAGEKARKQLMATLAEIRRSVATYGMITLRTDGTRVILAARLERPRSAGKRYDICRLEPDATGNLAYVKG